MTARKPPLREITGNVITSVIAGLDTYLATVAFYIAYRLAEDYLIVPRIMGRTVQVPAIVSLIAVLIGGVLLGIIGALVAIPSPGPSGCCTRPPSAGSTRAEPG